VTKPSATSPADYCNVVIHEDSNGFFWGYSEVAGVISELSIFRPDFTLIKEDPFAGNYDLSIPVIGSQVINVFDDVTASYVTWNGDIREYVSDIAPGDLTTWYRYPTPQSDTGKVSLGTSDYGLSVPADNALQGYPPHYFELRDIRDAIETVCVNYENPATNAAYTITAGTNNIFRVAIDSGQDDWTTPSVTHGYAITDEHWNDIELVLTQLEASELA